MSASAISTTSETRKNRKTYSKELLERLVHEHVVNGKTPKALAKEFDVGIITVNRVIKQSEEGPKSKETNNKETTTEAWKAISKALKQEIVDYLKVMDELGQVKTSVDVIERIETSFGVTPSKSTLARIMTDLRNPNQKIRTGRESNVSVISNASSTGTTPSVSSP
ncbi:hypothetical protein M422DRAFT_24659 [Sphaerobolus stellatus SS14]|nr:hypothetical protein M422DRAFT_24659 [Sphaerobolus stellatus SS14]